MTGLFGNLFDFNRDGKLSNFERAADLYAYTSMMKAHRKNEKHTYHYWDYEEDGEEDEEEEQDIIITGVTEEAWDMFDEDDRREILLDAGIDPDEYDLMSLKVTRKEK